MLQVNRFDIKTGLALHETIESLEQPKVKQIDHSYLEHWLQEHDLSAQFHTGKFYDGVNDADRLRLEEEGKVLIFTNGKDGYFTDPETAQLMTVGDSSRDISPIYAGDRNSPHNFVAYGSLVASDGISSSTSFSFVRILVIDDERRTHGDKPLIDMKGRPVAGKQLEKLYDKMGDGTMLVPSTVMRELMTPEECDEITARVFEKAGISNDITTLAQDTSQAAEATELAERLIDGRANRMVTQFRAATPASPGLIKGTAASSRWCERLGVDAIISSNDIKGDDGRLSSPGIKTIPSFWINRKSDGRYADQTVGPQVKGCIPEATLHEFNPRMKAQAEELAAVVADPAQLRQYYVQQKERQRERIADSAESDGEQQPARPDWLYEALKADEYGQLADLSKINRALNRYVKDEWLDNAVSGVTVPSAMAQHHSQLKPWEVCNKDLAHGAIVAYYRSPFPNVGAAAIAINNTEIIKEKDREAFSKQGVAYLNPWTAKNVAITDFDRDANGYFVGYEATVSDLPQQIRQQLTPVEKLPPSQQYEAWRSLSEQMVQQLEQGKESRIAPADYPLAVKEFIERNAPDVKPPEITKQKKVKHPWEETESHSAATWRAFEKTADNPTGKVANAGMTLQSFALEMQYAPEPQKEGLLLQISDHLSKQIEEDKLAIPDDAELQAKGFPAYHFEERIELIAQARDQLETLDNPQERQQLIDDRLRVASSLLSDIVTGPNAANLQAAVDTAKSAVPIDEGIHSLVTALRYKPHKLRQHQRDPDNYTGDKTLPTNTQEPIGWGVEAVNDIYEGVQAAQLKELRNEAYKDILPKTFTPQQQKRAQDITRTYHGLIDTWRAAKDRLRERRPEDQQPTLAVTTPGGKEITVQNLQDSSGKLPIWRAAGIQPDWKIDIRRNEQNKPGQTGFSAHLSFPGQDGTPKTELLGYLSPASIDEHGSAIAAGIRANGQSLTLSSPQAQIQAPFAQQNDADEMIARATDYIQAAIAQIEPKSRTDFAAAFWRDSDSMSIALKQFTEEICDRLQTVPEITLTGLQQSVNEVGQISPGEYTARFSEYSYEKDGITKTSPSVAIVAEDGSEQQFGALSGRSVHLPIGTTVTAHIEIGESKKTARMQVLDLVASPEQNSTTPAPLPEPEQNSTVSAPSNLIEFPSHAPSRTGVPMAAETSAVYYSSPGGSAEVATELTQTPEPSDTYSPTRRELRQWCLVAMARDDEPLKAQIIAKGQQLKALYGAESGTPGAEPPLEYQHALVVLNESDHQTMKEDIAPLQAIIQAVPKAVREQYPQYAPLEAEPAPPPTQTQPYSQMEMG